MALINCPECQAEVFTEAAKCVKCGFPISEELRSKGQALDNSPPRTLAEYKHGMCLSQPFWFLWSCLFIPAGVYERNFALIALGLTILIFWYGMTHPSQILKVTDRSVILISRRKQTTINFHEIKAVETGRGPFQFLLGCGWIHIKSKSLLSMGITLNGVARPDKIKSLIMKTKI